MYATTFLLISMEYFRLSSSTPEGWGEGRWESSSSAISQPLKRLGGNKACIGEGDWYIVVKLNEQTLKIPVQLCIQRSKIGSFLFDGMASLASLNAWSEFEIWPLNPSNDRDRFKRRPKTTRTPSVKKLIGCRVKKKKEQLQELQILEPVKKNTVTRVAQVDEVDHNHWRSNACYKWNNYQKKRNGDLFFLF